MTHITHDLGQFNLNTFIDKATSALDTVGQVAQNPLANLVQRVTIRSAYTPPQSWTGAQLDAIVKAPAEKLMPGQKSLLARLQPTITLDTSFGSKTIAPFGPVPQDAWKKNTFKLVGLFLGGLALYTAGGYYLGYKAGQRRAARSR
jgi:hypothetical protein